jgi:phosphoglycolate phosphatase
MRDDCNFSLLKYNVEEGRRRDMHYKAVIFDMDGTILNTIDDLRGALNYAMEQTGHRHDFTVEEVKTFFGSGVAVAITRALSAEKGMGEEDLLKVGTPKEIDFPAVTTEERDRVQKVFRDYYVNHCHIKTAPYPGIVELIDSLKEKGIKCAVVSNKQDNAVQELVKDMFPHSFDFHLGERTGIRRKPAPDMIHQCLKVLDVKAEECVYIGDSEVDVETAKNSNMDVIAVSWGFRKTPFLRSLGDFKIAGNAEELYNDIVM